MLALINDYFPTIIWNFVKRCCFTKAEINIYLSFFYQPISVLQSLFVLLLVAMTSYAFIKLNLYIYLKFMFLELLNGSTENVFQTIILHSKVALFSQFEVYNLLMKMFARYKPYSLNSSITSRKRLYNDHVLFHLSHFFMTLNAQNRHKWFIRIVVLSILKMSSRQMAPNVIGYFLLSKW